MYRNMKTVKRGKTAKSSIFSLILNSSQTGLKLGLKLHLSGLGMSE